MPSFTRVEFSVGPSLKSRRVVLLLEFPDEVLQQIWAKHFQNHKHTLVLDRKYGDSGLSISRPGSRLASNPNYLWAPCRN